MTASIGFVAIGRNEGERLRRCLTVLKEVSAPVIYVDSGSTDGSVEFARASGAVALELDTAQGFTMARGRNAGWQELHEKFPEVTLVHFIDGDCELIAGWLESAVDFLESHPEVAVVCGRRRERFPELSIYNRLMDVEWNTPVGEAKSCGGDSLMRLSALKQSGGFNEALIAGEEPELCQRLRRAGGKIWRIDHDMTWHDANMLTFGQWWKRHLRGGYGAVDVALRMVAAGVTGRDVLFAGQVQSARRWIFGTLFFLALAALTFQPVIILAGLLLIAGVWSLQMAKIALGARRRSADFLTAGFYGIFTMLAKWPQFLGLRKHAADQAAGRTARIIEYKQ